MCIFRRCCHRQQDSLDGALRCPRCTVALARRQKDGVAIDVCPACNGMWLDDKEIDKLLERQKAKGAKSGKKNDANGKHKETEEHTRHAYR